MFTVIPRFEKPEKKYPVERIDPETWGTRFEWPDIGVSVVLYGEASAKAKGSGVTVLAGPNITGRVYIVRVFGRTYPLRQKLRAAGLYWSRVERAWVRVCKSLEEAMDIFTKIVNEVL